MKSLTMTNVCIKGMPREEWRFVKSEAAREDKTIAEYLTRVLRESREKTNVENILSAKPVLSKREISEMRKITTELRREFEIR